jgi:hypothetical protein
LGIDGTGETKYTERGFGIGLATGFLNREKKVTSQMLASKNSCHDSIQSSCSTPSRQQVHDAPGQRAKLVSFAEPCLTKQLSQRPLSDGDPRRRRNYFTIGDRSKNWGPTGRGPTTDVWTFSNYVVENKDDSCMTQPELLEAMKDITNKDDDPEPSGRLSFIENLLKLET